MANIKITQLAATTDPASTDVLPIVDISADTTNKVSVADLLESAGDGTAAAPGISFDSDNDTGIYRAAANELGISTGGTQRVVIDASGNVGVGTAAATAALIDIKKPFAGNVVRLRTESGQTFASYALHGDELTNGVVLYSYGATYTASSLLNVGAGNGALNCLGDFGLNVASGKTFRVGVGNTERLRIDSSGNVGIGTSSPLAIITSKPSSAFSTSISSFTGEGLFLDGTNATAGDGLYGPGITWSRNGTTGTKNAAIASVQTGADPDKGGLAFFTHQSTTNTDPLVEALRIDSSGRLGVGTTSPAAKLAIHTTTTTNSSSQLLRITSANGALFGIETDETVSNPTWKIGGIVSGGAAEPLAFYQVGSEVARIDSSGNFGIGNTSPLSILSAGTGSGTNAITINGANSSTSVNQLVFAGGGSNNPSAAIEYDAADAGLAFQVGNYSTLSSSEVGRFDTSGRLLVGTSAARSNFHNGSNNARLQVEGNDNNTSALSIVQNYNGATIGSRLILAKSQGSTVGSNTLVPINNTIGAVNFQGNDGTEFVQAAEIKAQVDGTSGANDMPGRLVFSTTADGGTIPTERLRIDSAGNVGINNTTPLAQLHIKNVSGTSGFYLSRTAGTTIGDQPSVQIIADSTKPRIRGFGDALVFETAALSGTASEALRIDSSGRLLAGTTATGGMNGGTIVAGDATATGGSVALAIKYTGTDVVNTFGSAYSSANTTIGYGVRSDTTTFNKFLSTAGNASWKRGALQVGGELIYSNALAQNTAVGAEVVLTERFKVGNTGIVSVGGAQTLLTPDGAGGTYTPQLYNAQASGISGLGVGVNDGTNNLRASFFVNPADGLWGLSQLFSTGLYDFVINAGNTERMRIDSSGRLLVGTSSAGSSLVNTIELAGEGTGVAQPSYQVYAYPGAGSASTGYFIFNRSASSTVNTNSLVANGDRLGLIRFNGAGGAYGTNYVPAAEIYAEVDGTPGSSDMPGRLVFSTTADGAASSTERMRITSAGYIYFNTTDIPSSSGYGSAFVEVGASGNRRTALYQRAESTGTSSIQAFYNPNGLVGSISTSASSTAYNTSSDHRLKENVVDIADGITRVKQLQPRRFNFIADADTTVDGFIAHEAQTVVPEAVTGTHNEVDDDGNAVMQGIDQSKLVPLLTAALQEAIAKIETLEAKVAALEAG